MKYVSSVQGRGKKKGRRWVEGYYCRRKGRLKFYAYDNSNKGPRINCSMPLSRRRKKIRKY